MTPLRIAFAIVVCLLPSLAAQPGWETVAHTALRSLAPYELSTWDLRSNLYTGSGIAVFGTIRPADNWLPPTVKGMHYNLVTESWETLPTLAGGPGAPQLASSPASVLGLYQAVTINGKIYVFGGYYYTPNPNPNESHIRNNVGPVGVYDLATDTWSYPVGYMNLLTAPEGRFDHGLHVMSGKLVVFGGRKQEPVGNPLFGAVWIQPSVYNGGIYDPATDTWKSTPNLSVPNGTPHYGYPNSSATPGACEGVVATDWGIISWSGRDNWWGSGQDPLLDGGMVYHAESDTRNRPSGMESPSRMPVARSEFSTAWSGEHYLAIGGGTQHPVTTSAVYLSSGGLYDPTSDSWLSRAVLESGSGIEPTVQGLSVWTGSNFLVWGGSTKYLNPSTQIYYDHSHSGGGLYDPDTDTWLSSTGLTASTTMGHVWRPRAWTGDALVVWGGRYVDFTKPVGGNFDWSEVFHGGIYYPPRVAPTVRNLATTDPGATASNPLQATVGQKFRHRIVCYGTPEAALISSNLPSWLNIGFGGPGAIAAVGTATPFNPWWSSEGGTADGQWLHGTPQPGDAGLYSITIHAHNGVAPDSATYTVWIEVEGPAAIVEPSAQQGVVYLSTREGKNLAHPLGVSGWPAPSVFVSNLPSFGAHVPPTQNFPGGHLVFTPGPGDAGSYTVSVTAQNNLGPAVSHDYLLQVLPAAPISAVAADVNGDSVVNVLDVQHAVGLILSTIPAGPVQSSGHPQGDVNHDYQVSAVDVQGIVNWIVGR